MSQLPHFTKSWAIIFQPERTLVNFLHELIRQDWIVSVVGTWPSVPFEFKELCEEYPNCFVIEQLFITEDNRRKAFDPVFNRECGYLRLAMFNEEPIFPNTEYCSRLIPHDRKTLEYFCTNAIDRAEDSPKIPQNGKRVLILYCTYRPEQQVNQKVAKALDEKDDFVTTEFNELNAIYNSDKSIGDYHIMQIALDVHWINDRTQKLSNPWNSPQMVAYADLLLDVLFNYSTFWSKMTLKFDKNDTSNLTPITCLTPDNIQDFQRECDSFDDNSASDTRQDSLLDTEPVKKTKINSGKNRIWSILALGRGTISLVNDCGDEALFEYLRKHGYYNSSTDTYLLKSDRPDFLSYKKMIREQSTSTETISS